MNFDVYVDKRIGEQLERLAKDRGTSRNALIREALSRFIERGSLREWPDAVREFDGIRGGTPLNAPATHRFDNTTKDKEGRMTVRRTVPVQATTSHRKLRHANTVRETARFPAFSW